MRHRISIWHLALKYSIFSIRSTGFGLLCAVNPVMNAIAGYYLPLPNQEK